MIHEPSYSKDSAGFSLVEIMVGMVIALLSTLVIIQVFSASEARSKTTTSGDDAQNTAAIALYGLQSDIQQAGYGISAYPLIGCTITPPPAGAPSITLAPVTINPPVSIVPAGDTNTDTLLVIYGNGSGSPLGDLTTSNASPAYQVSAPATFSENDYIVAEAQTRPSPCDLTLNRVKTATGANPVTAYNNVTVASGDTIYNLGQSPKILAYAVRGGELQVCDYMVNNCSDLSGTNWVSIAGDIVSMRVQYGRDTVTPVTTASYVVNTYNQCTPTTTTPCLGAGIPLNCDWSRIVGVRLVLVARGSQPASEVVTASAPIWLGSVASATVPINVATPINLTATGADWNRYRYKVFQAVVPLRNMAWQKVQAGC